MPFPFDDYTPHGYLDTPSHTRNLTPRGVLRSYGAGFRWHYPAYAGLYGGQRETYRAGLRVAVDGALDLTAFDAATSPYHSKNIVAFELRRRKARARVEWLLVGEHTLYASIDAQHVSRVAVQVEYARLLAANGEWGESGLVGRIEDGLLILQGFEDGEAFVLWSSQPPTDLGLTPDPAAASVWAGVHAPGLPPDGFVALAGRRGDRVALHGVLGFGPAVEETAQQAPATIEARRGRRQPEQRTPHAGHVLLDVMMARGKTVEQARRRLEQARCACGAERARKIAEDDAVWSCAPRLEGDWPDHWRRGMVYDVETLRMMVKQPAGIYRHVWDAMQIQAPRVVLAEASIDALLLAYANPGLAQSLMLGTFFDAAAPNVPCSREDGSYNMIAADGSVCGTAPSWGYPFVVLEWLYALCPDRAWMERLYPRLADYLDWWLTHRRAADGWLFYACSWESGQDDSPRFGDQPLGGGHPVRHIRPVDLHAAFAHATAAMARFATALGRAPDIAKWSALAEEFNARTYQLWSGERYADFDRRAGQFTPIDDLMLLAPLALNLAHTRETETWPDAVQTLDASALIWPMNAWTAVEATLAANMPAKAAELAAAVCDRAYRCWDAREASPERTLPGIACEYWPLDGRCGGEGYGWGAFTTHLVLHALVGITPTRDALQMRPNLPPAWRAAGRRYGVQLHWRDRPLLITLQPLGAERVIVTLNKRREELGWGEVAAWPWEIVEL